MKIKVSEASGPVLDWMVAKAEGRLGAWIQDELRPGTSIKDIDFDDLRRLMVYVPGRRRDPYTEWKPSTNWSQGGPIIERLIAEGFELKTATFSAKFQCYRITGDFITSGFGPTPLIAAMRCFVASELGDEMDVPEELL